MRRRNPISHHLPSNHSGEAVSIWRDLHQRLNQLAKVQGRSEVNSTHLPIQSTVSESEINQIESLWQDVTEEDAILDVCLERLGILIALREAPPDPPLQGRLAKKRRLEPSNGSGNLSAETGGSPVPPNSLSSNTCNTQNTDSQGVQSPESRNSSPAPASSTQAHVRPVGSRLGTPLSDSGLGGTIKREQHQLTVTPARAVFRMDRRVTHRDQLPLQPGRLVAFKRPKKPSDSLGMEEWIMAKVVKCISGDKNRYEVQDVDDETRSGKLNSWNTTLKSVIPLPVREIPESYPLVTLAPGTAVLGLYPETTSFYRGTVKSGPTEKGRKYKVFFEDDEETGAVGVVMEHVVPIV
ncbi:SGF29 tudor-like domain-domain-containing protein [Phakopsora pachyrhizi]|uniref:SGF29 tudor-like domain-domain-containing protein n=1 Tax=Phakopsora pachyrhizi TaxID=170000 RepID=A0AAV0B1I9_PHAPC|nr:SGF29 tudor-like domain-domain-containing protein [Phakopsora pachyrhizi]